MGTHRPDALIRLHYRRAAVFAAGALPRSAAVLCAAPAVAAPPAADPAALVLVAASATDEPTAIAPRTNDSAADQSDAAQ